MNDKNSLEGQIQSVRKGESYGAWNSRVLEKTDRIFQSVLF